MRTLWLAAALLLAVPAAHADAEAMASPIPWIVFTEEAPVQVAKQREAEVAFPLARGEKVSGVLTEDPETRDEWLTFERDGQQLHIRRIYLTRPHPDNVPGEDGNLPYGREIVNRWFGIPLDYEANDLVPIPEQWARGPNMMLRKEACEALVEMFSDAAKEGLHLRVSSPYRSGERQVNIYTRNIGRNPAQRSSAPPGHSEHQLGSTVDLGALEGGGGQGFANTPESAWLEKNAARYGWVRSYYPHNVDETGYISEPWHWRFYGRELAPEVAAKRQQVPEGFQAPEIQQTRRRAQEPAEPAEGAEPAEPAAEAQAN